MGPGTSARKENNWIQGDLGISFAISLPTSVVFAADFLKLC